MQNETGKASDTAERVFFCTEGGAHKFWRVSVCEKNEAETLQTVCWGRIGTGGQTLTRTYPTLADAQEATNGLIAQKIAKGYSEVSAEEVRAAAPVPVVRAGKTSADQLLLLFDDAETGSVNAATAATAAAPLALF